MINSYSLEGKYVPLLKVLDLPSHFFLTETCLRLTWELKWLVLRSESKDPPELLHCVLSTVATGSPGRTLGSLQCTPGGEARRWGAGSKCRLCSSSLTSMPAPTYRVHHVFPLTPALPNPPYQAETISLSSLHCFCEHLGHTNAKVTNTVSKLHFPSKPILHL